MYFGKGNKRKALAKVTALRVAVETKSLADPEIFTTAIDLLGEIAYHIGGIEGVMLVQGYMERRRSNNNAETNKP